MYVQNNSNIAIIYPYYVIFQKLDIERASKSQKQLMSAIMSLTVFKFQIYRTILCITDMHNKQKVFLRY